MRTNTVFIAKVIRTSTTNKESKRSIIHAKPKTAIILDMIPSSIFIVPGNSAARPANRITSRICGCSMSFSSRCMALYPTFFFNLAAKTEACNALLFSKIQLITVNTNNSMIYSDIVLITEIYCWLFVR